MKTRRTFPTLIATVAAISLGTGACLGQLITFTPDNVSPAIVQPADQATFGYSFTVGSQDIVLSSVGVWDNGGDGLLTEHPIGIWADPNTQLLNNVTVPAGTAGTLSAGFRYLTLTAPVDLTAGTTYYIGAYYPSASVSGNDDIAFKQTSATLGTGLDIATGSGARDSTGTAALSYLDERLVSADQGVYGPNAQFTVVPEPGATAVATALVLLGFAFWRRIHSKATVVG